MALYLVSWLVQRKRWLHMTLLLITTLNNLFSIMALYLVNWLVQRKRWLHMTLFLTTLNSLFSFTNSFVYKKWEHFIEYRLPTYGFDTDLEDPHFKSWMDNYVTATEDVSKFILPENTIYMEVGNQRQSDKYAVSALKHYNSDKNNKVKHWFLCFSVPETFTRLLLVYNLLMVIYY